MDLPATSIGHIGTGIVVCVTRDPSERPAETLNVRAATPNDFPIRVVSGRSERQGGGKADPRSAPHLCNVIVEGTVIVRLGAPVMVGDLLTVDEHGWAVPVGASRRPVVVIGQALDSSQSATHVLFRPFVLPSWPLKRERGDHLSADEPALT